MCQVEGTGGGNRDSLSLKQCESVIVCLVCLYSGLYLEDKALFVALFLESLR